MKTLIGVLTFLLLLGIQPQIALANAPASASSAMLATKVSVAENDPRVKILQSYLEKYDSPLAPHAATFVREADANDIDWRLVAAISGVESTFGKHLPENSYNGWGWGIYGDNMIRFSSYDEAITVISKALREQYINKWKAQDVYEIGHIYAASPTWAERVEYFMRKIDQHELEQSDSIALSI